MQLFRTTQWKISKNIGKNNRKGLQIDKKFALTALRFSRTYSRINYNPPYTSNGVNGHAKLHYPRPFGIGRTLLVDTNGLPFVGANPCFAFSVRERKISITSKKGCSSLAPTGYAEQPFLLSTLCKAAPLGLDKLGMSSLTGKRKYSFSLSTSFLHQNSPLCQCLRGSGSCISSFILTPNGAALQTVESKEERAKRKRVIPIWDKGSPIPSTASRLKDVKVLGGFDMLVLSLLTPTFHYLPLRGIRSSIPQNPSCFTRYSTYVNALSGYINRRCTAFMGSEVMFIGGFMLMHKLNNSYLHLKNLHSFIPKKLHRKCLKSDIEKCNINGYQPNWLIDRYPRYKKLRCYSLKKEETQNMEQESGKELEKNSIKISKKQSQKLIQIAYYQAGKIVVQTLLPEQPPVPLITLNVVGITSSTSADTYIPIENTFNTQCCSFLESRLISLYGGKAASLLIEFQYKNKFDYLEMSVSPFSNLTSFCRKPQIVDHIPIKAFINPLKDAFLAEKHALPQFFCSEKKTEVIEQNLSRSKKGLFMKQKRGNQNKDVAFLPLCKPLTSSMLGAEKMSTAKRRSKKSCYTPKSIRNTQEMYKFSAEIGNNIFQSTIGDREIQIATHLAVMMVNYWNFYSLKSTKSSSKKVSSNLKLKLTSNSTQSLFFPPYTPTGPCVVEEDDIGDLLPTRSNSLHPLRVLGSGEGLSSSMLKATAPWHLKRFPYRSRDFLPLLDPQLVPLSGNKSIDFVNKSLLSLENKRRKEINKKTINKQQGSNEQVNFFQRLNKGVSSRVTPLGACEAASSMLGTPLPLPQKALGSGALLNSTRPFLLSTNIPLGLAKLGMVKSLSSVPRTNLSFMVEATPLKLQQRNTLTRLNEKNLRFVISRSRNSLSVYENSFLQSIAQNSEYFLENHTFLGLTKRKSGSNLTSTTLRTLVGKKVFPQINIFQLINSLQLSNLQRDRFFPGWFRLYLPDIEVTNFLKNVSNYYLNLGLQTITRPSFNELTLTHIAKKVNYTFDFGTYTPSYHKGIKLSKTKLIVGADLSSDAKQEEPQLRRFTTSNMSKPFLLRTVTVPQRVGAQQIFDVKLEQVKTRSNYCFPNHTETGKETKQLDISFSLYLENQIFPINYNSFSIGEKELIYNSLVNNCFSKAFFLINQNRQLLDFFVDSLLRFQILRQHQILYLFSTLLEDCSNSERKQ